MMDNHPIEPIFFKYSVSKLWKRIFLAAFPTVIGGLITVKLIENYEKRGIEAKIESILHGDPIWVTASLYAPFIVAIIGLCIILGCFDRMIRRKRVFLILSPSGLQYNELDFFFRIPYTKESLYKWDEILAVNIKHGLLLGTRIKLELLDRNITQEISVNCSEYDAEYILNAIKKNLHTK